MDKSPKRRKSNDNPYTLISDKSNNLYMVVFKDNKNIKQNIIITKDIFDAFNKFELEDISQMHKYDKYIEHSEIYEETLHRRMISNSISIEEVVENKIQNENLIHAIKQLNEIQKRRIIMYYFQNKTLREIALIENCKYVSIKNSLDIAIKKLQQILKNDLT